MSAELLNCPFCGSNDLHQYDHVCFDANPQVYRGIKCLGCKTEVPLSVWHRRTPDLSFLDKPKVVEVAYQAIKGEWTYFPTTEDEWKSAIATAIAAIKRMAKEGKCQPHSS